jgi:hypothetical protein
MTDDVGRSFEVKGKPRMARPSPITVGTVVLAVGVLGAAVYVLSRSRERVIASSTVADEVSGAPPRPAVLAVDPPNTAAGPRGVAAPASPLPVLSPPPPLAERAAAAPDAAFAAETGTANERLRSIAARNQRLITESDERVFEALKLSDATRAAIRRINDEASARARVALEAAPPHPPRTDESAPERRAAIKDLLGEDAAGQFDNAESAVIRHLRIQARTKPLSGAAPAAPSDAP